MVARNIMLALLGLTILGVGSIPATAQVARKNEVVSLRDALKEMLQQEGAASLKKLTLVVDAEKAAALKQRGVEASGSYTLYQGLTGDGEVVGSVLIVDEEGKEGPLQVLIALRPGGEVYDLGFTVFGEDKGKPALSWAYLKQYVGKTPEDELTLGKDLNAISGATWTSTSVADAVRRGVMLYEVFFL